MRIGIDLDGIIADYFPELCFRLKHDLGIETDSKTWPSHRVGEFMDLPDGWLTQQFYDYTFWMNCVAKEDAWQFVNKHFFGGDDIFIVTCRYSDDTIKATEEWLDEWAIPYNELHHSIERLHKIDKLLELDCKFMVDDDPHEAKVISERIPVFLKEYSYNKHYDAGNAIRIKDLNNLESKVRKVFRDGG